MVVSKDIADITYGIQ